jgi:hypothetical protein
MAKVWHVVIGGKQYGPLSNSDLKSLAESGKLQPQDHIWKEGLAEWIPASKVKGLFPPAPPPPPPKALAPPTAPPPPPPNFPWPEPSLGEVVVPDDDASEAWKNRDSPMKGFGFLSGMFHKHIQDVVVNHRQRVFRHFENGRQIVIDEVLDRLESGYSNRGFKVHRYTSSLIVTKQGSGTSSKIDTSGNALANVGTQLNGFVRVAESGDNWVVTLKGEAFFWPQALQQFMGAAGVACVALIFFWPCLCLLPFAFNVDADQAKAVLQEDLKTPVEKLAIEFV